LISFDQENEFQWPNVAQQEKKTNKSDKITTQEKTISQRYWSYVFLAVPCKRMATTPLNT